MKIYTSYFAKIKELEKNDIIPISICGKCPDWYKGLQYKKLAPKYGFFMEWKKNHDNDYYIQHFNDEVLSKLDINEVIKDILELLPECARGKDIVLICYEKPSDFCHRHLVAEWLTKNGYSCFEWSAGESGMTNKEFVRLYKEGRLEKVSVWLHKVNNKLGKEIGHDEMVCAMHQGKYYIRVSKIKGLNRQYHDEIRDSFIREFYDKNPANAYFETVKKDGYEKYE